MITKKYLTHHTRSGLTLLLLFSLLCLSSGQLQENTQKNSLFSNAQITMDKKGRSPTDLRFSSGNYIPINQFFNEYRQAFNLSAENDAKPFRAFTDKLRQTHHRFKQYYKGLEVAEVQYILHEQDGLVFHAHGNFIHGLDLEVTPALAEHEALQSALMRINAQRYMWDNPKNEAFLKKEQNDAQATYFPEGELMLSAGHKEQIAENFRLVYRFDIFAERPLSRDYVDVDAQTGQVIGVHSRINYGNVQGYGSTLYNGMQPIIVSDEDFPLWPPPPSRWHLDDWNAYSGSGESWWMADPTLGNQGGYADSWYEVLETNTILLTGTNPVLSFFHRYSAELPVNIGLPFDGWDGMNVRISTDSGKTWQVLMDPTPAYTCSSLFSFGRWHNEGLDIPGWAGLSADWGAVTFDLSTYSGKTIQLRFAFAADGGLSTVTDPELFGWQIDDIKVSSSAGVLFFNNGFQAGIDVKNLFSEVTLIEGKYRLRETAIGGGIATYNSLGDNSWSASIDFVDSDSLFSDADDKPGVSVHWALESVYDYYLAKHGRKSYDDADGRLLAYANWLFYRADGSTSPNNAMWTGSSSLYGIGDGTYWGSWGTLDIVGHEITHGVTKYSAGLIYQNEPGALNESFSDIFGTALEFYKKGNAGDWLMAKDNNKSGSFARSMANPNLREDPDTYQGQYWIAPPDTPSGENDNGGVHTNSGVQNFWFYLLCQGGSGVNDKGVAYSVSGVGIEAAEQIAYRNLTVYLQPTSGYFDAANYSVQSASDLFGQNSAQEQAVIDAWYAVGIFYQPRMAVNKTQLSFVGVADGFDTLEVIISNYGLQTLEINQIDFSIGNDFQVISSVNYPLQINFNETYTLRLTVNSNPNEISLDTLNIRGNDPNNPVKTVLLQKQIVSPAQANTIYAFRNNGELLRLDALTGSGSLIDSTDFGSLRGLAVHPLTGVLYGTSIASNRTRLLKIDAVRGQAFAVCDLPVKIVWAIAFDKNGALYGADYFSYAFFRINPGDGDTTNIGATGIKQLTGLAINPLDDQLWATDAKSDKIFKIDKTNADTTLVGRTGIAETFSLAFDETGKLFGLRGYASAPKDSLLVIDTLTAIARTIGYTGFSDITSLTIRGEIPVGIEDDATETIPLKFALSQNYPNPFNPKTVISYQLPVFSEVELSVYNILGQKVATLISAKQPAGSYKVEWDASGFASGVYIYRLQTEKGFVQTRKMLLLK